MKNIFRFDYKSGKSVRLEIKDNLIFIKEYKNNKIMKDFFITFTELISCCYKKIKIEGE